MWFLLFVALLTAASSEAFANQKLDDFEFADENSAKTRRIISDHRIRTGSLNKQCYALNCKIDEICRVNDDSTLQCVKKHPNKKACKPCSKITPYSLICGSDNRTYTSLCQLDYYSCILQNPILVECEGSCPCKEIDMDAISPSKHYWNKHKSIVKKKNQIIGVSNSIPNAKYSNTYSNIKTRKMKQSYTTKKSDLVSNSWNEVLANSELKNGRETEKSCSFEELQSIGNRLLDWFSVIMAQSPKRGIETKMSLVNFPKFMCKNEVKWMFRHLDANNDSILSAREIYKLENEPKEKCLKLFFHQCGIHQYRTSVSPYSWCKCFQMAERPCLAILHKLTSTLSESNIPTCDTDGYYAPKQCDRQSGKCWCVNKHGVELPSNGKSGNISCARSTGLDQSISSLHIPVIDDDDGDDYDSDRDVEGSASYPSKQY